jgi:hypothetical protein
VGGTFLKRRVPPNPLQETLTLAGIRISPAGKCEFRHPLEVLDEGLVKQLLTTKAFPIPPRLTAN